MDLSSEMAYQVETQIHYSPLDELLPRYLGAKPPHCSLFGHKLTLTI